MEHTFLYFQPSKRREVQNPIIKVLEQVVQAYHNRGFKVYTILGDGKFKHIQQLM